MDKLHLNKVSSSRSHRYKGTAENVVSESKVDNRKNRVKHYPQSPARSYVEDLPLVGHVSHITTPEPPDSSQEVYPTSRDGMRDLHISVRLMEEFMELASENTKNDLETCGILGAFLQNRTFYVTTLIIPKQESSSSTCQALNEEEIHAILEQRTLFPVGWIHTHPSQTCFLSSVDLHTQYSFQVMLPEAIAIVMAPTDSTRGYGIFRLTEPGGMGVVKECNASGRESGSESGGFHQHPQGSGDGSPIYCSCANVYINPNLRFEIFDLRPSSSSSSFRSSSSS